MLRLKSAILFIIAITNIPLSAILVYFMAYKAKKEGNVKFGEVLYGNFWKMTGNSLSCLAREVTTGRDHRDWLAAKNSAVTSALEHMVRA